jgi:hypothetical protein
LQIDNRIVCLLPDLVYNITRIGTNPQRGIIRQSALWEQATTATERTELEISYEVNKEKMSTYKDNVDRYNLLSAVALVVEGYLLYRRFISDPKERATADKQHPLRPDMVRVGFGTGSKASSPGITLGWNW